MRGKLISGIALLLLGLASAVPAAAQESGLAGFADEWMAEGVEETPFGRAMQRWIDGIDESRLGLHLAANPGDSARMAAGLERFGVGDLTVADDAGLMGIFALLDTTLAVAPVETCDQFMGDNSGDQFFALLANVDSTIAEQWIVAFEDLFLGLAAPGVISAPADEAAAGAAFIAQMGTLSEDQIALFMRSSTDPQSLTAEERCTATRVVMRLMNRIPEDRRAGIIRGLVAVGAQQTE